MKGMSHKPRQKPAIDSFRAEQIATAGLDATRGALMGVTTDVLGYPVDLAASALRPFGYNVEQPVGGSDWLANNLTSPTGSKAEWAGRIATGMITPGPEELLRMGGMLPRKAPVNELITYHGSPHRINNVDEANPMGKFDLSKVGTGEGAQAYGHGIYLAENPNVARQYRDTFAIRNDASVDLKTGESLAVPAWVQQRMDAGEVDSVIDDFSERLRKMHDYKAESPQQWLVDSQIQSAERILKAAKEFKVGNAATVPAAHFYTVDLPDEHIAKMLDWDAPLSEQPEAVRKALIAAGVFTEEAYERGKPPLLKTMGPKAGEVIIPAGKPFKDQTGREIYESLASGAGPAKNWAWKRGMDLKPQTSGGRYEQAIASEYLRSLGIPGIRYLDGGSRAAGEGTRNFVIFDPEYAKILKRE